MTQASNEALRPPGLQSIRLCPWRGSPRLGILARGRQAGRFAPLALAEHEATEEGHARLMGSHAAAVEASADVITRWDASALDRHRLPHPPIGKVTVRETALFTLLHNVHHVEVTERRRQELAGDRGAAT